MAHITKKSGSLSRDFLTPLEKGLKDFLLGEQKGTDSNIDKIFNVMKNRCVKEFKLTRKKEQEEGY